MFGSRFGGSSENIDAMPLLRLTAEEETSGMTSGIVYFSSV